ncbi:MAG: GAF domain-containing protein [Thermoguttaceae bacterium]|nr:GAF domain-containing protein [Thermoguttaceae bacterium]
MSKDERNQTHILSSKSINEQKWEQYLVENLHSQDIHDFIVWFQEKNPFWNQFPDAVAILESDLSFIWTNQQFRNWFPKAANSAPGQTIHEILNLPQFMDPTEENVLETDPFEAYQKNQQIIRRNMLLPDGRFFEITLSPWECPGEAGTFLKLFIHEATERHKLLGKLKNIHKVCESFGTLDNLQTRTLEERRRFLLSGISYMAEKHLHYEIMELRLFNPSSKTLDLCAHRGISAEAIERKIKPDVNDNGIIGYVAVTRKSYLCQDISRDPHYLPCAQAARSSLTLPIIFKDELLGVLNVESSKENAFNENDRLYSEIFVHEIANAINILRVFDNAKQNHLMACVGKAHDTISTCVNRMILLSSEIFQLLTPEQIQLQKSLYQMLQGVDSIRQAAHQLGAVLPVTRNDVQNLEDFVEEWKENFAGKRILLIDGDEDLFRQGQSIFNLFQCDLDFAQTGTEALRLLKLAKNRNMEYLAILSSLHLSDYEHTTQFYIDLAQIFERRHPPLVVLQEEMTYDPTHTATNIMARYPARGYAAKPFYIQPLFKTIKQVVERSPQTEPNFISLGDHYFDPWALPPTKEKTGVK